MNITEGEGLDALVERAMSGDRQALDDLLASIQPRVRQICGRILIFPEDAEEATQDALLLVATKIGTYRGQSKFTTWLYSVASNSARATYRSLKRRSHEQGLDVLPELGDPRTTSVIAGSRLDLLEALDVLAATHPQFAEAVVLRDIQELDYAEIAEVMGVPLGTVKTWIHRARTTIRPLLVVSE